MKNPHLYIMCGLPFAGKTSIKNLLTISFRLQVE